MEIFGLLFMILLVMTAVYTIFNIKDFLTSWYKWILAVFKGIWKLVVWAWKKIISIFKRG